MWLPHARQLIVITFVFSPWVARVFAQDTVSLEAIDWSATLPQDRLVAQLGTKRVIFVGETHDRYDHHLNQFEIIKLRMQVQQMARIDHDVANAGAGAVSDTMSPNQ